MGTLCILAFIYIYIYVVLAWCWVFGCWEMWKKGHRVYFLCLFWLIRRLRTIWIEWNVVCLVQYSFTPWFNASAKIGNNQQSRFSAKNAQDWPHQIDITLNLRENTACFWCTIYGTHLAVSGRKRTIGTRYTCS